MEAGVIVEKKTDMRDVEELLKILLFASRLHESQQINLLLDQIKSMEESQAAVMKELTDLKQRLGNAPQKAEGNLWNDFSEKINNTMAAEKQHLQEIKHDLSTKAKQVVQKFKNIGIKALNNVCRFLGVQEKLIAMRDEAKSSEMDMKNAFEKVTTVESELNSAVSHFRNAGRAVIGKEQNAPVKQKENKVFALFKGHYKKYQEKYARRVEKLDKAIEKCNALEKRASILDRLSENKEKISSDKNTEHKRYENTR